VHLQNLISDILDVSKIEAGRHQVTKEDIPTKELVNSVMDLLSPLAQEIGLQVFTGFDARVPAVIFSDPTQLKQILLNVVGNSIKFTDEGQAELNVQYQRIKASPQDSGFLIFTVNATQDIQESVLRFGFNGFMAKPFNREQLIDLLKRY